MFDKALANIVNIFNNYHNLYKEYLTTLQLLGTFAQDDNKTRIRKFTIFLEAVALIKNCQEIQNNLDIISSGLLSDEQQPQIRYDAQIENKGTDQQTTTSRTILDNAKFDIRSMLTNGLHNVVYQTTTEGGKNTKDNVDVILNPIFYKMPEGYDSYLSIIDGSDDNAIDSLFNKNFTDITFLSKDFKFTHTIKYLNTISNFIEHLDDMNRAFKNLIDMKIPLSNLILKDRKKDTASSGDIEAAKDAGSINPDVVKQLQKQGAVRGIGLDLLREGPMQDQKLAMKQPNFNIKTIDTNKVFNKNNNQNKTVNNKKSSQEEKNQASKQRKEMYDAFKNDNLKKAISESETVRINDIKNVIFNSDLDKNYSIKNVLQNPSNLDNLFASLSEMIDMCQKYNLNDATLDVLVTLMKKYQKNEESIKNQIKKCIEGYKKLSKKENFKDLKKEISDLSKKGIVQFSADKQIANDLLKKSEIVIGKIKKNLNINSSKDFLNLNDKDSTSKTVIKFKFERMQYIIKNYMLPMILKINKAAANNQEINLQDMMQNYLLNITKMYQPAVESQKVEATEYVKFLKEGLYDIDTNKILDYSYIIGFKTDTETQNISNLIILSDFSNLKEKENFKFTNDFMLDIPFVYEIDISKIMKDAEIPFVKEALMQDTIKIQLIENDTLFNRDSNNFITFNFYKFKQDRIDLIEFLKQRGLFLETYLKKDLIFERQ